MTLVIVRQGYAPMAVEASFIPWGTRVSISSVVRTVTGMAMIASASAPAIAEKCPTRITSSSYTNRPMMIDGADSSTSFTKRITVLRREVRAYSAR